MNQWQLERRDSKVVEVADDHGGWVEMEMTDCVDRQPISEDVS